MLSTIRREIELTRRQGFLRPLAFGDFLSQRVVGCGKFCGPLRDPLIEFVWRRASVRSGAVPPAARSRPDSPLRSEEVSRSAPGNRSLDPATITPISPCSPSGKDTIERSPSPM